MAIFLKNTTQWSLSRGTLLVFVISILVLIPVFNTPLIPLNDYPFHLARIVILSDLENPIYQQFYKQGSFLLPNMAMDMIAVPLASFFGAELASRVFVGLSLLSMLFGTLMLHAAAHKRLSPWPLLAVVLLFNGIFRYGFLNYIFGIGVAFFTAGVWLKIKPKHFKFSFSLIASLFLVLLHFEAFAVYAVIIGSIEIHGAILHYQQSGFKSSLIPFIISIIPFLLTIAVFIFISPTAEVASQGFNYPSYLGAKPYGALYSLLTGILWLDILSFSALFISFVLILFTKRIKIHSALTVAFLMMSFFLIILPSSIMGSHFVDIRLGPAIALLWIAAIDIKEAEHISNLIVAALALLLAVFTSTAISSQWHAFNKTTSEIIEVFDKTEPGATIFSATSQPYTQLISDTPERQAAWTPPLKHVASYAVLSGPKFVPMTFVDPTKQPLNVTDNYRNVKAFQSDNPRKTFTSKTLDKFLLEIKNHLVKGDWPPLENVYVFVMGFDAIKNNFISSQHADWVSIIQSENNYALIKLNWRNK